MQTAARRRRPDRAAGEEGGFQSPRNFVRRVNIRCFHDHGCRLRHNRIATWRSRFVSSSMNASDSSSGAGAGGCSSRWAFTWLAFTPGIDPHRCNRHRLRVRQRRWRRMRSQIRWLCTPRRRGGGCDADDGACGVNTPSHRASRPWLHASRACQQRPGIVACWPFTCRVPSQATTLGPPWTTMLVLMQGMGVGCVKSSGVCGDAEHEGVAGSNGHLLCSPTMVRHVHCRSRSHVAAISAASQPTVDMECYLRAASSGPGGRAATEPTARARARERLTWNSGTSGGMEAAD